MIILVVTLLVLISLGVVTYPLLARQTAPSLEGDLAHELTQRLRRARDRLYEEMRTLQQEYFLNHLTEQEYETLLESARTQAAMLLRQQEQVQQTLARLDQEVEEEVQRLLSAPPPSPGEGRPGT